MNNACGILLSVALIGAGSATTAAAPPAKVSRPGVKTEHFDRDPGWEGLNSRLMPKVLPTYMQDFGYSKTNFAGQEKGEMGGRVCRAPTPAYYAAEITPRTLNDKRSASGTFAINATAGNTAVFFGWFNAQQPGGSGRPINSFGLNIGGEPSGGRLAVRLIGNANKSCGTFVTPFIPGKYRPTPIKNDGTRYTWTLNRGTFENSMPAGAHDFGYSATSFAGGAPGEVGGIFWRGGEYAYYADRVGPLTLDDRLEASGRVVLVVGGVDADMYLGWFNSTSKDKPPTRAGHFLGVHVGGPTRVGHYFHPAFTTASGKTGHANAGPLLTPGKVYQWSLVYDPAAENGQGAIQVTLGEENVTLPLRRGCKQGVRLDRFGLFTPVEGGQIVKIYLDDLKYTASRLVP
jgi:hypothetical protein